MKRNVTLAAVILKPIMFINLMTPALDVIISSTQMTFTTLITFVASQQNKIKKSLSSEPHNTGFLKCTADLPVVDLCSGLCWNPPTPQWCFATMIVKKVKSCRYISFFAI